MIHEFTQKLLQSATCRALRCTDPIAKNADVHKMCLDMLDFAVELERKIEASGFNEKDCGFDFVSSVANLIGVPKERLDDDKVDQYCRDWMWSEWIKVVDNELSVDQFVGILQKEALEQKDFPNDN